MTYPHTMASYNWRKRKKGTDFPSVAFKVFMFFYIETVTLELNLQTWTCHQSTMQIYTDQTGQFTLCVKIRDTCPKPQSS